MKAQSHTGKGLVRSSVYNGLAKFSSLFFGIASTLLLTRTLTESELGVWAQFLLFTTIGEIIRHSLVRNALLTLSQRLDAAQSKQLFWSALLINFLFSVFSCIAFLVLVFGFDIGRWLQADALNTMMLYFIPGNFLLTITSYYEWRMQLAGRFDRILLINVVRQATNLLLLIAGIFWWHQVSPVSLVWYFNGGLLAAGLLALYTHAGLFQIQMRWPAAEIRQLVQYGRFALITNSASSVFRTTDHFMVSAILSTAAVAPLSLCVRLINIIDIPSQVLSEVLFVRTAQQTAGGDHNKAAATFEFAVGSALALVLPAVLVLCLFPSFFLLVIGGEKYMEYGWLLQLVCATALVMPFMRQFGTITDAAGLPALNASVMCVLMLLNMVACYLGISLLGLAGAPVAVFSAQVLVLMVILVIAKRRFGVSFARIWRSFIGCYALMWDKLVVHQLSRIRRKNNLI